MVDLLTLFTIGLFAAALPGPDILYISKTTLVSGLKVGLLAALGVLFASLFYLSAAGLGLGAVGQSPYFQLLIGIFGSLYLLWIAFNIWNETLDIKKSGHRSEAKWKVFLKGMAVHLSNPKAIIFFSVVLAPFLDKNSLVQQIMVLTLAHMTTFLGIAYLISRFGNFMTPRKSLVVNRISAVLFMFFALQLSWNGWQALQKIA